MIAKETFTIASAGTVSNYVNMPGYRLIGLLVPAMDSATLGIRVATDSAATLAQDWKSNTHGAAPTAQNLGSADTGSRYVAVPEAIGEAASSAFLAIVASAAQNGGARAIVGFFVRMIK